MSFVTIPGALLDVGKPIKREILLQVKDNLDDLDFRLTSLEIGAQRVEVAKLFLLNASSFQAASGLLYFEADRPFTLTSAFLRIFEKNSLTGTLEMDVRKSTSNLDNGSFSSVFTTKPSINFASATDYSASTNQVFDVSKVSINTGDFLRIDLTQMPTGGILSKLLITVFGE